MNKNDMLRDAMRLDEMGIDPDKVMVTHTLEEYAKAYNDEVDEFDAINKECDEIEGEVSLLDAELAFIEAEINYTFKVYNEEKSFARKIDLKEDLVELDARKYQLINKRNTLIETYQNNLEAKANSSRR